MKITAISDIHGSLINISKTDLLIIAGDFSPLEKQCNTYGMNEWMGEAFIPWLKDIPAEKIVFIAGNHDFICDSNYLDIIDDNKKVSFKSDILNPLLRKHNITHKVKYLECSSTIYKSVRIYGCPYVEGLYGWAFSQAENLQIYRTIPKCDILITHHPPVYNSIGRSVINGLEREFGSYELMETIKNKKPKLLFCGHIHGGDHNIQVYEHLDGSKTEMYNCSIKDENYDSVFKPIVIDVDL